MNVEWFMTAGIKWLISRNEILKPATSPGGNKRKGKHFLRRIKIIVAGPFYEFHHYGNKRTIKGPLRMHTFPVYVKRCSIFISRLQFAFIDTFCALWIKIWPYPYKSVLNGTGEHIQRYGAMIFTFHPLLTFGWKKFLLDANLRGMIERNLWCHSKPRERWSYASNYHRNIVILEYALFCYFNGGCSSRVTFYGVLLCLFSFASVSCGGFTQWIFV